MKSRTLCILKPDCVRRELIGKVIHHLEDNDFKIKALKMVNLTKEIAKEFYKVHKGKSFFNNLIDFMTSGKSIVMVLESENAVERLRDVIGATDPKEAKEGTIRYMYAENKQYNVIHAADSKANAEREINFFFSTKELIENDL